MNKNTVLNLIEASKATGNLNDLVSALDATEAYLKKLNPIPHERVKKLLLENWNYKSGVFGAIAFSKAIQNEFDIH